MTDGLARPFSLSACGGGRNDCPKFRPSWHVEPALHDRNTGGAWRRASLVSCNRFMATWAGYGTLFFSGGHVWLKFKPDLC